ncbi:4-hydroxy-tetrahydrodipicolinate reductase [Senna tora]|uniref:4-hydroxy-tetrahydrodipicolinate reductase n=1 Tax=Senna tora TaxID=362788 RepID=A0A834TQ80_9FABA|nr:4-hydroxy-tetrahydrodipicolinate reductase [Senna tora]
MGVRGEIGVGVIGIAIAQLVEEIIKKSEGKWWEAETHNGRSGKHSAFTLRNQNRHETKQKMGDLKGRKAYDDEEEREEDQKTMAIWDCGSPLYDSYELMSLCNLIDKHLMLPSSSPCEHQSDQAFSFPNTPSNTEMLHQNKTSKGSSRWRDLVMKMTRKKKKENKGEKTRGEWDREKERDEDVESVGTTWN